MDIQMILINEKYLDDASIQDVNDRQFIPTREPCRLLLAGGRLSLQDLLDNLLLLDQKRTDDATPPSTLTTKSLLNRTGS